MRLSPITAPGRNGTRFKLFPQPSYLVTLEEPETVTISCPAGSVGPGPSDNRMYTVDAIGKEHPYGLRDDPSGATIFYTPPWTGDMRPPVQPNRNGHFDHLRPGSHQFEAAHVYGSARRTLDVWETYMGRRVEWHFAREFERLELSLLRHVDNAFAGYGFLEVGAHVARNGEIHPFSLNFDVIAHEVGHLIVYSEVGVPTTETEEGEYYGFHESAADLVALVAALHFESVVDHLLQTTRGNLYTFNRLNRFAELSENDQIRLASNTSRLSHFAAGWKSEHQLSQPLTGAVFDMFVDIFHEILLDAGLISSGLEELSDALEQSEDYEFAIQPLFDDAFADGPRGFKQALLDARDTLGCILAETFTRLSPHHLNYDDVGRALLEADRAVTGGAFGRLIRVNLRARDIGSAVVGPRIEPPDMNSHVFSDRTAVPEMDEREPRALSYFARRLIAGRPGIPHF